MGDELYTAHARSASVIATYEGIPFPLSPYLESLSYTDNASGALDDISLVLDLDALDRVKDGFQPEKGKDLDVKITMENWYQNGLKEEYHCGNFVIDDITITGGPKRMTLKAISQPAESDFKERRRSKTWQKVTLRQIVDEIQAKYKMSKLFFNAEDIKIESVEQSEKTDSEFLEELCSKYGLSLKVYKVGFVIFKEESYESGASFEKFGLYPDSAVAGSNAGFSDWTTHEIQPDYSWNSTLQGTYTGAVLKYTNGKQGEEIEVKLGTDDRVLYLSEKVDSREEALKIAAARINEENKKQVTMSFRPSVFSPRINASYCADIINMGRCDGKYYIDKVDVTLDASGLSQRIQCHKVFQRFKENE